MKAAARLLLLVALLLPFRGTVAMAGVLCQPGAVDGIAMAAHVHPDETRRTHQHAIGEDLAAGHDHQHTDASDDDSPLCDFCSTICSAPAMPAALDALHDAVPASAERFPALTPPRSTAVSSGLERPPRTV